MERTIRFRGLTEGGDWVYGHYVYNRDRDTHYIVTDDATGTEMCVSAGYGYAYAVVPESVGQLVGIHNDHDFEIYEGDIIHSDQWQPTTYQVLCDRGAFYIAGANKHEVADIKYAEGFKVIGNIHQNPELVKELK